MYNQNVITQPSRKGYLYGRKYLSLLPFHHNLELDWKTAEKLLSTKVAKYKALTKWVGGGRSVI